MGRLRHPHQPCGLLARRNFGGNIVKLEVPLEKDSMDSPTDFGGRPVWKLVISAMIQSTPIWAELDFQRPPGPWGLRWRRSDGLLRLLSTSSARWDWQILGPADLGQALGSIASRSSRGAPKDSRTVCKDRRQMRGPSTLR